MMWLSNGSALRNAATVLGAACSSKRASKVKSPARITSLLISSLWIGGRWPHGEFSGKEHSIGLRARGAASHLKLPAVVGPAENAPPPRLGLRLGGGLRRLPQFRLRRRRRHRQILAFHGVDQLAVRGPSDRRAGVRMRRRGFWGQLDLRHGRRGDQQKEQQIFRHHCRPETRFGPLNRIAQVKSIGATDAIAEYLAEARKLARPNVMSRALISAGRIAMSAATATKQNTHLTAGLSS